MQMDKLSVAIKYLKYLQERVKKLEAEQAEAEAAAAAKQTYDDEQAVFAKMDTTCNKVDEEDEGPSSSQELEIDAKVCNKNILVKILGEKRKGLLVEILEEIEKLNLGVVSASVAPFGSLAHDITIIAEMEYEVSLSAKDVVTALRCALKNTTVPAN